MTQNTKIEWADHTFNPWIGCTPIGPGCDNCYAAAWAKRYGRDFAVRTHTQTWADPVKWNKQADAFFAEHGRRQRVFCASLGDIFDNQVPVEWRMDLFKLIADTPNLDWLILTKRIGNVMPMCAGDSLMFEMICDRVWLGATVVNQVEADRDIPKLFAVPAHKRFLSMEPLLGPVDLHKYLILQCDRGSVPGPNGVGGVTCPHCQGRELLFGCALLDWVIVGGESGPGARPMHPDWARSLRDQCATASVPFLFKQWGEWVPRGPESLGYPLVEDVPRFLLTDAGQNGFDLGSDGGNGVWMQRAGRNISGRLLDGFEHNGAPA